MEVALLFWGGMGARKIGDKCGGGWEDDGGI